VKVSKPMKIVGGLGAAVLLLFVGCCSCGLLGQILGGEREQVRAVTSPEMRLAPVTFSTATAGPVLPANTPALSTATPVPPTAAPVGPTDTPIPAVDTPAPPTIAPVPPTEPAQPQLPGLQTAQVVRIVDGDTIEVSLGGQQYTVRYILVDTPETKHPTKGIQPFGPEATEANRQMVEGQTVYLEKDVSDTDQYDRLLRYVYLADGRMVNEELLRLGLAQVSTWPPDVKYVDRFLAVQNEAQASAVGLWGSEPVAIESTPTPVEATGPAAVADPAGSSCPQGCEASSPGCEIKGNINGDGEKIYHEPGFRDYNKTKIDPSKGERWFCTSAEAVSNGWRAAMQ